LNIHHIKWLLEKIPGEADHEMVEDVLRSFLPKDNDGDLVSISSTFSKKLVRAQITIAQKKTSHQCLFVLLGSACIKAESKKFFKLSPGLPRCQGERC